MRDPVLVLKIVPFSLRTAPGLLLTHDSLSTLFSILCERLLLLLQASFSALRPEGSLPAIEGNLPILFLGVGLQRLEEMVWGVPEFVVIKVRSDTRPAQPMAAVLAAHTLFSPPHWRLTLLALAGVAVKVKEIATAEGQDVLLEWLQQFHYVLHLRAVQVTAVAKTFQSRGHVGNSALSALVRLVFEILVLLGPAHPILQRSPLRPDALLIQRSGHPARRRRPVLKRWRRHWEAGGRRLRRAQRQELVYPVLSGLLRCPLTRTLR